jgi:hypothetical protein
MDCIENYQDESLNKTGKKVHISEKQQSRLILEFMKKHGDPFKNRHFYKQLFQEQDKAEKIQILE